MRRTEGFPYDGTDELRRDGGGGLDQVVSLEMLGEVRGQTRQHNSLCLLHNEFKPSS